MTTKWRDLSTVIETEIRSGLLKPGEQLPSLRELAERGYAGAKWSRATGMTAYKDLAMKGFILLEHGRRAEVVAALPDPERDVLSELDDLRRRLDEHECDHERRSE